MRTHTFYTQESDQIKSKVDIYTQSQFHCDLKGVCWRKEERPRVERCNRRCPIRKKLHPKLLLKPRRLKWHCMRNIKEILQNTTNMFEVFGTIWDEIKDFETAF